MHPQDVTAPWRHISKCPAHNKALDTIIYESQKKPGQGSRFRECFFLLVIMIRICAIVCLMSVTHSHFPLKGCAKNSFLLDLCLALALKASIHLDNYRGSFLNLTLKACGNWSPLWCLRFPFVYRVFTTWTNYDHSQLTFQCLPIFTARGLRGSRWSCCHYRRRVPARRFSIHWNFSLKTLSESALAPFSRSL